MPALLAAASFPACCQQPMADLPSVRLEAHDGKTAFYLGEPIRLDLVFENHTGGVFQLNGTDYGDLSEKVEITPAKGWFQWQMPSGHDYSTEAPLMAAPMRIPVQLDEGFVFRAAGEYRVRVTTGRLTRGSMLTGSRVPAITTNEITLEMREMPADAETEALRSIRADLANADDTCDGQALKQDALRRLATLHGDQALTEKVHLLEIGDDEFRSVYREAFATTHDLEKQLTLLQQAWTDPRLTPRYDTTDAMNETRALLAGRNIPGWQQIIAVQKPDAVQQQLADARRADMLALLNSMPRRVGESRTHGAYFLIESGGLSEADRARAVNYAVEEFPHMDATSQHMLLETARPPLRDPRLIPMLQTMLAADPADKDATAALLEMVPVESAAWITQSVCAPKGVVLLSTFKDATVDRVPAVDACLSPLLRTAPATPRAEFEWKQKATQAARFATPAILPDLRAGWKSAAQDGAVLAVLMRNEPASAVDLLNKHAAEGKLDGMLFYETQEVYRQLPQPFPLEVQTWLRTALEKGTDSEAGIAAYALSVGGDRSDAARVEQRLLQLRSRDGMQPAAFGRAEIDLITALGSNGTKTFLSDDRRRELGQGCSSDQCRLYLH